MNADTARSRWTHVVVAALSAAALFSTPARSAQSEETDIPYPLPDPDLSHRVARGIILRFEAWPPDTKVTEPLVRKLRNAGLEPDQALALFKSWVFAWDEVRESRFAENMCFELAFDDQVSSLFASCTPDVALEPPRPADD